MPDAIALGRAVIEAFNAGDWAGFEAVIAPDGVYDEVGSQRRIEGASQTVEAMKWWKQAFPDATGTVTNALGGGNNAALQIRWEGTQTGPLEGPGGTIPPSGKRQVTEAVMLVTGDGERITLSQHYFDMMTLLQQIGAIPAAAS